MTNAETPLYQSREWLAQKYVSERLSCDAIAALCGLRSHVTIMNWLRRLSIKARTLIEARVGRRPALGMKHSAEAKEKIGRASRGRRRVFTEEHKKKISASAKGRWTREKNPRWNNGASLAAYGPEFTVELREEIRRRDGHACQFPGCGVKQQAKKLPVHHIDGNRKNNSRENLITLCRQHHLRVHREKGAWEKRLKKRATR